MTVLQAVGSTSAVGAATQAVIAYNESSLNARQRSAASSSLTHVDTSAITALVGLPLERFSQIAESYNVSLAENILADLTSEDVVWEPATRLAAFNILKELSRLPGPSRVLAAPEGIERIQGFVTHLKQRIHRRPSAVTGSRSISDPSDKEQVETLQQLDLALRVLNNVLVQHPSARTVFAVSSENMRTAIDLIERPGTPMLVFLCARLVFFASLGPTEALKTAVQQLGLVETFARRLSALMQERQSVEVEMAINELLKAFFNVGLFYPKIDTASAGGAAIVGEKFDEGLLPFLAPTIAVLTEWRAKPEAVLKSPHSHAIAVLLNYPVASYEHIRAGSVSNESAAISSSPSGSTLFTSSRRRSASSDGVTDLNDKSSSTSAMSRSRKLAAALLRGPTFSSPFGSNAKNCVAESPFRDTSIVTTLLDKLEAFLLRYFISHDIDDRSADRIAEREDVDLESTGEPPMLLLRKLLSDSTTFRAIAKNRILPASIDRTIGLDKRSDVTGIMIRLMSSHNFPRLARASGEALMSMCGGQATQMTTEIGYGPCAGFLMNIGQSHAMPGAANAGSGSGKTDGQGRPVDPITGKVLPSEEEIARQDVESGFSAMTMEEKEAEAERLFGLFDRLDRTGVMKVDRSSHPIHQAVDSGRFAEIDEQEEREQREALRREDEETEREVEREMRAFKARKAALGRPCQEDDKAEDGK